MKKNATDDSSCEKLSSCHGKAYFNLKAANGHVIGKRQLYESDLWRDNGIVSLNQMRLMQVLLKSNKTKKIENVEGEGNASTFLKLKPNKVI